MCSARLLDHLIRQDEERRGERDPERLHRLAVEDQLELHGLLHGQVGRFRALEELVHVPGGAPVEVHQARGIGHEPSGVHEVALLRHHREPVLSR